MALRRYNPLRALLLGVGAVLSRLGLLDGSRVERTTDLAWPRIVTGLARMSKSTADVAMVGLAIGPVAITGLGFAGPFWGLAFALGGGIAGGTISQVSQRFGADAHEGISAVLVGSAVVTVVLTLPLALACWFLPTLLIDLIGTGGPAIEQGATYLRIVGLGIPFAALNLIGSRTLVGADDAWTPMVLRGGGAVINIVLNGVLIFGLGMGVAGAAIGTVTANVVIVCAFAVGLLRGGLPLVGTFPVRLRRDEPWIDRSVLRDLVSISWPLVGTNLARNGAGFPKIWLVGLLGPNVTAAYVVAMRVRGLMDTPNWGFSLASSSLVGQALGAGDERDAGEWASAVMRHSLAVYTVGAVAVFVFAEPIARLFVAEPAVLVLVPPFIWAACVSVVFSGVDGAATGPLRASGDTRWPLYSQLAGMYLVMLPVLALAVVTPIGVLAVYAAIVLEKLVPASITFYRYRAGTWKVVSRQYRPGGPEPSHA